MNTRCVANGCATISILSNAGLLHATRKTKWVAHPRAVIVSARQQQEKSIVIRNRLFLQKNGNLHIADKVVIYFVILFTERKRLIFIQYFFVKITHRLCVTFFYIDLFLLSRFDPFFREERCNRLSWLYYFMETDIFVASILENITLNLFTWNVILNSIFC